MGDFVDRGSHSVETFLLLMALKVSITTNLFKFNLVWFLFESYKIKLIKFPYHNFPIIKELTK